MNRIFHARISFYMYLLIALVAAVAFYLLWNRMPIGGALMLLLLIVVIERVIHTTYTITTDGRLVVSYGRFQKPVEMPVNSIQRVEKLRSLRLGHHCLVEYLLICYDEHKHVAVMPVKEDEFLETLHKRRTSC